MKTALTQKVGIFKAYYEEKEHANTETYEALTEEEMTMLLADETREVVSQEITEEIIQNELGEAITKETLLLRSERRQAQERL